MKIKTFNQQMTSHPVLLKGLFFIVFVLGAVLVQGQIKMPGMVEPNDSWGVIDVNKLYGGVMQVNTHTELLAIDVQYLKKGMLFVVYDDDAATAGVQTQTYMFVPAEGSWDYASPFDIPSAEQNNTIGIAGLESSLVKVNLTSGAGSSESATVYYGTLGTNDPTSTDVTGLSSATINSGVYDGNMDLTLSTDGYFTVAVPVSWRNPLLSIGGDETFNIFLPVKILTINDISYQVWQSDVSLNSGIAVAIN